MSGYAARITKGLIAAGEFAVTMVPGDWAGDGTKPGVAYCGGYSAGALNILGVFDRFDLVWAGYPMVSGDVGDTPSVLGGTNATGNGGPGVWGNDVSQSRLAGVLDYLEDTIGCVGPHLLMGGSHGASVALRYAHDNPSRVRGVACFIGAVDTEDIRANNRSGYAASINAAFGLTGGASVPVAKNPAQLAATWPTSVPVRLWYSADDPICVPATQTAFNANAPIGAGVDAMSFGNHGHSTNGLPWGDMTAFALERLSA